MPRSLSLALDNLLSHFIFSRKLFKRDINFDWNSFVNSVGQIYTRYIHLSKCNALHTKVYGTATKATANYEHGCFFEIRQQTLIHFDLRVCVYNTRLARSWPTFMNVCTFNVWSFVTESGWDFSLYSFYECPGDIVFYFHTRCINSYMCFTWNFHYLYQHHILPRTQHYLYILIIFWYRTQYQVYIINTSWRMIPMELFSLSPQIVNRIQFEK